MLIDPDGRTTVPRGPRRTRPADALVRAFAALVTARRFNDQADALVRQGRLAVYPSSHGQEACQVAAASGARATATGCSRPTATPSRSVARGVDPVEVLTLLRGDWHSRLRPVRAHGSRRRPPRSPPSCCTPSASRTPPGCKGEDTVVLAMCGDGATSEGDFHEALNFAAVFDAPVVFLVQNNEYAISVPLARQTAAPSLAHKGIGYGDAGRAGRRQRRGRAARGARRRRRPRPAPATDRRWSRRTPTGCRRTPTPTTPPATASDDEVRRGSRRTRSPGWRRYLRARRRALRRAR